MSRHAVTGSILVMVLLSVGCAKKPATAVISTPAPTGASSSSGMTGTEAGQSGEHAGTSTPADRAAGLATPATRPAPNEFVATPDLQDIHFEFDRYAIRPQDRQVLDADARWLKSNGRDLLLIEGHCDERGTAEYNLALGDRRARAAMDYLVAQGVAGQRITIISYGKERPLCTEHNEACWAKNRRAHFLVKRG
jgi:peptidoglycan-associated lipoprotein